MSYRRNRRNYLAILVVLLMTTLILFAQSRLEAMSPVLEPSGPGRPIPAADALAKVSIKYLKLGGISVSGGEIDFAKKSFDIKARLDHAVIKYLDVTGDIAFAGAFEGGSPLKSGALIENLILEGRLTSAELTINNIPLHDVRLAFRLKNGLLQILEFNAGGNLRVYGKIYLKGPAYPIDIAVFATNINIGQLLLNLKSRDAGLYSGLLSARVLLKGPADKPDVKCALEVKNGSIQELYFTNMTARLSGKGPILRIEDSRIMRETGFLVLAGDMDLRNMGKPNLFENISMAESSADEDFSLSDNLNVGFKDCLSGGNTDPRDRNNEVELGYKVHESDALKFCVGEDSGFFGIEHREKF